MTGSGAAPVARGGERVDVHELLQPLGDRVALGQLRELVARELVLVGDPFDDVEVLSVFEPAVRVRHRRAEDDVGGRPRSLVVGVGEHLLHDEAVLGVRARARGSDRARRGTHRAGPVGTGTGREGEERDRERELDLHAAE
jgi:hypothetical protein